MQYENLVYAVNGLQLSNNEQENIIILIYASNAEIAKKLYYGVSAAKPAPIAVYISSFTA